MKASPRRGLIVLGGMDEQSKTDLLKRTPLFHELSRPKLSQLAVLATVLTLKKSELLFLAGEPATRLFVIAAGTVRAYRVSPSGREQVIHVETTGATLAEVAVFDDGPYPASASAEEDCILLAFDRSILKDFCLRNPEVMWAALQVLAGKLRKHAELIDQLALQDVVPRIVRFLLEEVARHGKGVKSGIEVNISLSHQQLAARIGSAREVVSRSLARLEKDGLITILRGRPGTRGTSLILEDVAALKAFAKQSRGR